MIIVIPFVCRSVFKITWKSIAWQDSSPKWPILCCGMLDPHTHYLISELGCLSENRAVYIHQQSDVLDLSSCFTRQWIVNLCRCDSYCRKRSQTVRTSSTIRYCMRRTACLAFTTVSVRRTPCPWRTSATMLSLTLDTGWWWLRTTTRRWTAAVGVSASSLHQLVSLTRFHL